MIDYLNRYLVKDKNIFSFLYLANTFGAMTGVAVTAVFLVELLGFRNTLFFASILNFLIALIGIFIAKRLKSNPDSLEIEENSNVMDGNSEPADDVGHGTHIAGIIAKNAENSIIIPFKIVNKDGGKLSDVIKAIDQSIDAEVDVINISLGVQEASFSLEEIVEKASEKGVIIVAAAGNFSSSEKFYPAAYEETISVAATYYSGKKLESSNYGDWIDVAAKGYHIYSSVPYNDYGFKNGTSQAAAIVTAKVSKLLSDNPDMTFDSVIEALSTTSSFVKDDELSNVPIVTLY